MSWALISDSSCNLRDWHPTAPNTTFAFAPLKIRVGEREFVDDLSLDVHELNVAIQSESSASSSSCPSVGEWSELFKLADKTICMPISEGVSGSYNAAATARDMVLAQEPERQIHLVNSRAAGGKMDLIFLLFDRYLTNNPDISFEDACAYFDELEQNSKILFSLCNYENLAKAGRIPKAAGIITRLPVRPRTPMTTRVAARISPLRLPLRHPLRPPLPLPLQLLRLLLRASPLTAVALYRAPTASSDARIPGAVLDRTALTAPVL